MPVGITRKVPIQGFDPGVTPPWAMVPIGNQTVMLNVHNVGSLRPRSLNPEILAVTQHGPTLSLTSGYRPGRTWIKWERSDIRGSSGDDLTPGFVLEVSIKEQVRINTAFWYVTDGRNQITSRKMNDLDKLIKAANNYLQPQANMVIVKMGERNNNVNPLKISEDLGSIVRPHEWDIITSHANPNADFNVFFVAEFEDKLNKNGTNSDVGGAVDRLKNCIFEDDPGYAIGKALAHETMHRLIYRHSKNPKHLIADGKHGIGPIITKAQANILNPSGT